MDTTYPFRADDGWRVWGLSFGTQLSEDPGAFNVSEATAGAVLAAAQDYSAKLLTARSPDTKSKPNTQAKNDALDKLKRAVKPVVVRLQASDEITDTQRVELGLKVIDRTATPSRVPAAKPVVEAMLTGEQSVRVRVVDPADPSRRGRPRGVKQIVCQAVFTDGSMPPADVAQWPVSKLEGRTTFDLMWPGMAGPHAVWISCYWVSNRNGRGPSSNPARVNLPGSGLAPAAGATEAKPEPSIKIAA